MDKGGFNQSEEQTSYVLDLFCIMRLSNVHPRSPKKKPWGWGWSNFLIPPFIRHVRVIWASLALPCE